MRNTIIVNVEEGSFGVGSRIDRLTDRGGIQNILFRYSAGDLNFFYSPNSSVYVGTGSDIHTDGKIYMGGSDIVKTSEELREILSDRTDIIVLPENRWRAIPQIISKTINHATLRSINIQQREGLDVLTLNTSRGIVEFGQTQGTLLGICATTDRYVTFLTPEGITLTNQSSTPVHQKTLSGYEVLKVQSL